MSRIFDKDRARKSVLCVQTKSILHNLSPCIYYHYTQLEVWRPLQKFKGIWGEWKQKIDIQNMQGVKILRFVPKIISYVVGNGA